MAYILGIDQGGSKTAAIVGDEQGNILGMGKSFGAVHSISGMDKAMEACKLASSQALEEAGLAYSDIDILCGGISGMDWDYEKELIENALKEALGISNVHIVNDCIIAMRSSTENKRSAVICAGSGVNCAVRDNDRQIVFGYYIPDNLQGGEAIGEAAVQKVFDAEAGIIGPTILKDMILEYLGVESAEKLLQMRVEEKLSSKEFLSLPVLVEKAALEGDAAANSVFEDFARAITPYIHAGMEKFGILNEATDVVLSGSIFKCRAESLIGTIEKCIMEKAPKANIIHAGYEPIVGAYLLGLDDYHIRIGEDVYRNINEGNYKKHILRKGGNNEKGN